VPSSVDLERWRALLDCLSQSAPPWGETFDLCRSIVRGPAPAAERNEAARLLLEGAMADSTTPVDDAQEIMRLLKAVSRGEVMLAALATAR
jgi:hypothetical protein